MDEGEPTQEATAPEGAPASPETPPQAVPQAPAPEAQDSSALEAQDSAAPEAEDSGAPEAQNLALPEAQDAVPSEAQDAPAEPQESREAVASAPALDWPHVRGFQAIEPPAEALAERPSFAEDFRLELSTRAARFARSVDESIVLSSEGVIRWLGDPVARLVGGEAMLAPRAVLLADEALAGEDRTSAEHRVALWLAAHLRKILGPLVALSEGAGLADDARAVATKVAEALGVLERDRVRAEVKTLDQTARGALRKLGVRFGSLYIYAPALLKPAARGLCTLLWTVRRGAEAGADRLLGFSAAGRTSFANEGLLSPDAYRVAGFRLCGERVVRVDIIERLTDLIRAALPDYMRSGTRAPSEAYGFVVTPQMTSLTGCSGESFSSILRSLGFESVKASRAVFEAANRKAPTEPVKRVAAESAAAPVDEAAQTPSEAEEASAPEGGTRDPAPADASAEAPAPAEEAVEAPPHEAPPEGEPPHAEPASAESASEPGEAPSEPDEAEAEEVSVVAVAATAEEPASPEPEAAEGAEAAFADPETEAHPAGPAEEGAALIAEASPAVADEEIEIWRPAPRRPRVAPRAHAGEGAGPRFPSRHRRRAHAHGSGENASAEAKPAEAPAVEAPAQPAPAPDRGERPRRFERKGHEEPRRRDDRRPQKDFAKDFTPRREPRTTQVDPDSPFAKLAALKPLLERRDKRP